MKYQRSPSVITLWVLAGVWSATCLLAGVSSLFGSEPDAGSTFVGSILCGGLPLAAVWWHDYAQAHRPVPMPRPMMYPQAPPPPPPRPQLPERLLLPWNRLAKAWDVVAELQRQGWIDGSSTRGVPESMKRLHRLAIADGMTDQLGGRRSGTVTQQITLLGDLLVALADEAVEHQATIGTDFTPATLAAAAQRLAADRAAYQELMELGGAWGERP
ncbi:hypothetical protein [Nocardia sp. NPDC050413]|uniref:hypothetical protein n=1 Tax=Nocardia sp. NPDC050413 TaxID=3155784 RepID=UPI0033ECAAC4